MASFRPRLESARQIGWTSIATLSTPRRKRRVKTKSKQRGILLSERCLTDWRGALNFIRRLSWINQDSQLPRALGDSQLHFCRVIVTVVWHCHTCSWHVQISLCMHRRTSVQGVGPTAFESWVFFLLANLVTGYPDQLAKQFCKRDEKKRMWNSNWLILSWFMKTDKKESCLS